MTRLGAVAKFFLPAVLPLMATGCGRVDSPPPVPASFHNLANGNGPRAVGQTTLETGTAKIPPSAAAVAPVQYGASSLASNEIVLVYDRQIEESQASVGPSEREERPRLAGELPSGQIAAAPSPLPPEPASGHVNGAKHSPDGEEVVAPLTGPSDATPELVAIARQADTHVAHALSLAERGAVFTARAELIKALRISATALDAQRRTTAHTRALDNGLRAIDESKDFMRTSVRAFHSVAAAAEGHRTSVLEAAESREISPAQAVERYLTYAQVQLGIAGGDLQPAASALYALGKLEMSAATREIGSAESARAVLFFQAALVVNPRHALAANELGVLLARHGRLAEAKAALQYSVRIQPQPEAWRNLSIVHQGMGELDLAARADWEWRHAASASPSALQTASAPAVQWVDPVTFVARARSYGDNASVADTQRRAQQPVNRPAQPQSAPHADGPGKSASTWLPWSRATRQ